MQNPMKYGKAKGIVLVQKYLPRINPFKRIDIISTTEEWNAVKDKYGKFVASRVDMPIGEAKKNVVKGTSGLPESIPSLIEKVNEQSSKGVVLVMETKKQEIPRYEYDGGFNISFNTGENVIIEIVGKGFDGHELTQGLAVHERHQIPWDEVLFMRDRISLTDKAVARYLIVLLITLITTKSAAGYVGLFAVIIGTLLKRKERKDIIIVVIMIAAFTYLIYNYYTQGSNSILEKYFFGKFVETQKRSLTLSSGGARLVAMQMGWKAAISHPFGIGYLNWENQLFELYGTKFGTGNALFTQLGTRGFIAFFISLYLAIEPAWKRRKSWLEFMIYIFLFLYITIVQAKILYPAIVLAAYLPRKDWQTRK